MTEQERRIRIARARIAQEQARAEVAAAPQQEPASIPTRGAESNLSVAPGTTPEMAARIPEGMVYDPRTGGYVDTAAQAERGGGLAGAASTFFSGVPFIGSYFDEAAGAVDRATSGANPEIMQETVRQSQQQFEGANPKTALGMKVAGGITALLPALPAMAAAGAPAGASLLSRTLSGVGAGATFGAAEGGVYGYGEGEGAGRGETASTGALIGGGAGAVLGGLIPGASDGVSAVVRALSNRPSKAAARKMGLSPTSVEQVLGRLGADDALSPAGQARIAAAGPRGMLADSGESARDLLDTAIQRAGPGAKPARDAIESRASAAGQDVRTGLDALAPKGQVAVRGTPMRELYDAAYSAPIDYASDAGRRIEELLPRIPRNIVERANRLIQMDTDAINPRQIIMTMDGPPSTALAIPGQSAPPRNATFQEMPNVLQLDYITRALNDVARAGDGQGALGGNTTEGRVYAKLSRQLRTAMRDTVPAYGKALDTAATEIGARQAQEFGQTAMRSGVTRSEIAEEMASMGAAEVAHLRIGLRQGVEETLDNVRRTITDPNVDARQATQALKDFSTDAAREKLRMVFGDKAADGFIRQLDEAATAMEMRASTATNSRTFARTETDRGVKDALFGGPVSGALEGESIGAIKRVVQSLSGRTPAGKAKMEQQVYEEIARLLTQQQGGAAVQTMQQLMQIGASRPISQASAGRAGRATAGALALPAYLQASHR